jgi:hypothetical protein
MTVMFNKRAPKITTSQTHRFFFWFFKNNVYVPLFIVTLRELDIFITVAYSKTDQHILEKSSAGFTYYWHCSAGFTYYWHCSIHLWCSLTIFTFQSTSLVPLSDDLYFLTVIQHTSSSTILNSCTSFMDICVTCWQVLMLTFSCLMTYIYVVLHR